MALTLPTGLKRRRGATRPRRPRPPLTERATRVIPVWRTARTPVLSWAGFGCITAAAFELHTVAGLAAAGISLLVGEALGGEQ